MPNLTDTIDELDRLGVRLRCKGNHWLFSRIGWRYWTTIGKTIWYPVNVRFPTFETVILQHELVHVRQQAKWGRWLWLWLLCYAAFPLPVGLAWFRWRVEREAYLVQLQNGASVDQVVNWLSAYVWTWPRKWMRRWFESRQKDGRITT